MADVEDGRRRGVDGGDPTSQPPELFGVHVPFLPPSEIPIARPDLQRFPFSQDYPWNQIQGEIVLQLSTLLVDGNITLTAPPPNISADFSLPTHPFAKSLGQTPPETALWIAGQLGRERTLGSIGIEATPNGFVNFEADPTSLGKEVLESIEEMGDEYGNQNIGNGQVVVLDVSSPNVAKYMSVGHLRSTVIGESLARIYRAGGFTAIRDNHLGDWGTQFGMLGRAKELWGEEIDQAMPDAEPVHKLYGMYVRIHEEVEREKQEDIERLKLEFPDLDDKELKRLAVSTLEQEGRAWFKRLEEGDPAARELLEEATAQSLLEFMRVYELLGSEYEYVLGESFYEPMLPDVVDTFTGNGIATKDDKGAVSVEFPENTHLNRLVIQKSDGSSLYATRDLAALVARTAWFNPDKILYVVGADQKAYFREVFAAFGELAQGEGPKLEHTYFGMISLPEGKMSTRKGNVIFLEDVLREAIARARTKVTESSRDMSPEEIETVAHQVGVGSVIYMDLGQGRERNIKFDWDRALSLDGNSAPYIQYAHARAKSLLRKADEADIAIDYETDPEFDLPIEAELIKQLAQFPNAIVKAFEANEPSVIATYTFKTAELFSRFYKETYVLGEKDPIKRNTRLRLTQASAQVIKNGLYLLGIQAPEKM